MTSPAPARPRVVLSARVRILGWFVLLMVIVLASSVVVVRHVLVGHVRQRVDVGLAHEVTEVRDLAASVDPTTGERFSTTGGVLRAALSRSVPEPDAAAVALLGGRPFARTAGSGALRLDQVPELARRWSAVTRPQLGTTRVAAGTIRYVAVPVFAPGDPQPGVFVSAVLMSGPLDEVTAVTWTMTRIGVGGLLVASLLAWGIAGRILAPVRQVTDAARTISESDLSRRLPVSGHDEISALCTTFNTMLARLQDAFAAQRAFLDDAGHELRTPLTIIRSYLELTDGSAEQRRWAIGIAEDELDRMTRLVEDLLALAGAEQPDFLRLDIVDVAALLEHVLAKARGLADRDWYATAAPSGWLFADGQRLEQALLQLAQNAVDQTVPGARIGFGAEADGERLQLHVTDDGPGIALEDQNRVMARFARGRGAVGGSHGMGLGLPIVSAIAAAHGGALRLESAPGHGATFTIDLPRSGPPVTDDPAGEPVGRTAGAV